MRLIVFCGLLLCLFELGFSQAAKPRPKFSDYPVRNIYHGKPVPPVLNKSQRRYRTMIREGAKSKVEFAGRYTVPRFGCGAGCSIFYLVDSISGRVFNGFSVADLPLAWMDKHGGEIERMEFHPESRLLQINGCPGETHCGFYDYVMVDGVGLKLVRRELLPENFQ